MQIIKNRAELEITAERKLALDLIEHGIKSVLPSTIMSSAIRFDSSHQLLTIMDTQINLTQGRLFVIGGGKASGLMAETLETIIGSDRIAAGLVNCKDAAYRTKKIQVVAAGHPVPDERGILGVDAMLKMREVHSIGETDVVLCLISGGGSALMPCPAPGISLTEKQETTRLLLSCGADIHEINTVRKHLSLTKGGGLAAHFAPATVISLILSDVVGDNLDVIASGPTVPDASTFSGAMEVLKRHGLLDRVASSVRHRLEQGASGVIPENPTALNHCKNYLIGNNRISLEAMKKKAEIMGLASLVISSEQVGKPEAAAQERVKEILSGKYSGYQALFVGGETTPVLPPNPGKGGRNQHFAATVLQCMKDFTNPWVCVSIGSDGSDFLPDVAGAIVDAKTMESANQAGADLKEYLKNYDTNSFFVRAGHSLIRTGNTGTNVCDLVVFVLGSAQGVGHGR